MRGVSQPEAGHPLAQQPLLGGDLSKRQMRGRGLWCMRYFRASNERLLRLLGWTEAELSSTSYWDFAPARARRRSAERLRRGLGAQALDGLGLAFGAGGQVVELGGIEASVHLGLSAQDSPAGSLALDAEQ
jgi:hypothetical protein